MNNLKVVEKSSLNINVITVFSQLMGRFIHVRACSRIPCAIDLVSHGYTYKI